MNLSLITDRYRRWKLERAIKRAELALERATPKQHGPAWERTARLILKRDNLDPVVRRHLEAIVGRRTAPVALKRTLMFGHGWLHLPGTFVAWAFRTFGLGAK